ncbi:ankyrin repeat domain-containing protein SOWAHA [Hoplias malabaricus]|uniref:ankyrin repeat domain-containing protein SOWAHA n=1 Tax=Hoplias malabaricus TaxID=27720 RepID=UPI0034623C3B
MGELSEPSLLDYIYSSGGKVKNSDLLKTYKQFISHSDLQLRAKYREEFKLIIDRIAVCKSENGEKYLILKKKYRQQLQERDREARAPANTEEKCNSSSHTELQSSALDQQLSPCLMESKKQVSWFGPTITVTEAQEEEHTDDEQKTDSCPSLSVPVENSDPPSDVRSETTDGEDELDKDSGSKSESEQDEECTGSVGSASVALDPIEKEWIYSAACGRLTHLTELLKQDASLVNKKDFAEFTALHWAAKHGKEDMAVAMADAGADVNTKAVSDIILGQGGYTPLHIAALHGHHHILDLLITNYGAKENIRDNSGHLASYYLHKMVEDNSKLTEFHSPAQVNERRNRKLTSLFQSRKKWGSAEDLAPVPEERTASHQLMIPAFRPRKFSR